MTLNPKNQPVMAIIDALTTIIDSNNAKIKDLDDTSIMDGLSLIENTVEYRNIRKAFIFINNHLKKPSMFTPDEIQQNIQTFNALSEQYPDPTEFIQTYLQFVRRNHANYEELFVFWNYNDFMKSLHTFQKV